MIDSALRIHLLSHLSIYRGETIVPLPGSVPARSLLAYLCLNRERMHPRPILAGIFWPDLSEERARRALTQALWHLRRAIPAIVEADHEMLWLSPESTLWVDVDIFKQLVLPTLTELGRQAIMTASERETAVRDLCKASELYRGDLLEGLQADWVLLERERLRDIFLQGLEGLIQLQKLAGRYEQALETALRLAQADPLREQAHREVMRLYASLNRPDGVLKQYETCRRILWEELEVQPEQETQDLVSEITRKNAPAAPHLPQAPQITLLAAVDSQQPGLIPLVGRTRERNELLSVLEGPFDGSGGVILVEGEAGVGKTRLVQEVARDVEWRGGQVLWGKCNPLELALPFGPLADALGSGLSCLRSDQLRRVIAPIWLQVLKPFIPQIAAQLPDLPPAPPLKPDQEQVRISEAFVQVIQGWAHITPLTLILEDLQWSDTYTLDLLPGLAHRLVSTGAAIVCTYRGEEIRLYPVLWEKLQAIDRAGARGRLVLDRLDSQATSELVRASLRINRAAPLFEARLFRETEGNPLFVLETLRGLYDEGVLRRDEKGTWSTPWDENTTDYAELRLPAAVEQVIGQRLSRLHPPLRAVLDLAAVIGSDFDFSLLSSISEQDTAALLNSTGELVRRRFIQETPLGYRFNHDKIRQVVYQAIDPSRRISLHQKAGTAVEKIDPGRVNVLAHHYEQGQVWSKAALAYLSLGKKTAAQYLTDSALSALQRAQQIIESHQPFHEPQNSAILFETFEASYPLLKLRGDFERLQQIVDVMLALAESLGTPEYKLKAFLQQSSHLNLVCNQDELAYEVAQQTIALAREHGLTDYEAQAWLVAGITRKDQMQNQAAETALKNALALYREAGSESEKIVGVLLRLVFVYRDLGDISKAQMIAEEALNLSQDQNNELNLAMAHNALAWITRSKGEHQQEAHHCQEMYEQMHSIGYLYYEGVALNNLSLAYSAMTEYLKAIQASNEALKIFRRLDNHRGQALLLLNLSSRYKEIGCFDEIDRTLAEGLSIAQEMNFADEQARMHLSYAEFLIWREAFAEAEEHILSANEIAERLQYPSLRANVAYRQGELYLAMSKFPVALNCFQQGKQLYQEANWKDLACLMESYEAICQMKLGNLAEALQRSQAAVDGVEDAMLVTSYHHYQVLSAHGQAQVAQPHLAKARELVLERVKAAPDETCQQNIVEQIPLHKAILAAWMEAGPRQALVRLPRLDAPTGRPLKDEERVEVYWTVRVNEDVDNKGEVMCRQTRLLRLVEEAKTQGAVPTVGDLAAALEVSQTTIKRDLAALRKAGQAVKTRGG